MAESLTRRVLFFIIAVPVLLLLMYVCIMNAHAVDFLWSPVAPTLEWPLFVFILAAFAVGFLVGALFTKLKS